MYYYLNEDKTTSKCDLHTWGEQTQKMCDTDSKHVASDILEDKWVSTVWLGLDHNLNDKGDPLIFETMIFDHSDGKTDMSDIYCERYSTWQEAEEGHKKALEWVKNGCKDKF